MNAVKNMISVPRKSHMANLPLGMATPILSGGAGLACVACVMDPSFCVVSSQSLEEFDPFALPSIPSTKDFRSRQQPVMVAQQHQQERRKINQRSPKQAARRLHGLIPLEPDGTQQVPAAQQQRRDGISAARQTKLAGEQTDR